MTAIILTSLAFLEHARHISPSGPLHLFIYSVWNIVCYIVSIQLVVE